MPESAEIELYDGQSRHGIEGSFRVLVPKEWRPEGGPTQFLVIPWPLEKTEYDFLKVIPRVRLAKLMDDLKKHSLTNDKIGDFKRTIGRSSKRVEFDKFGRLALSESLLRDAGITKECDLVGCFDHFEIWDPAKLVSATPSHKQSTAEVKPDIYV